MVMLAAAHADRTSGNGQCPAAIDSGTPDSLQRRLDDDAERALRADEEMGQIVTGRGLLGAARRAHELALGVHHAERKHDVLHRAVAHGVGARSARRGHAADRGVGAGIDREEQSGVAQLRVQRLARDAGLDDAVEIFGMNGEHLVHASDVEADAAMRRVHMALERRARAERNDRGVMRRADLHAVDDVFAGSPRTPPRPAAPAASRSDCGRAAHAPRPT